MWSKPPAFVCDLDLDKFSFRNFKVVDSKIRLDVFYDDKKSVTFNLCPDADSPVETPYGLDSVQNGDGSRRTLMVYVSDPNVVRVLSDLDNFVVATALANSKEWFKKAMTEDEVRLRYKPLLSTRADTSDVYALKFKIKCNKYSTRLHLRLPNGTVVRNGATTESITRGSLVVPVLTMFNMWFMNKDFGLGVQAEDVIITSNSSAPALPMFHFKRPVTIIEHDVANDDVDMQFVESKTKKAMLGDAEDTNVHLVDEM